MKRFVSVMLAAYFLAGVESRAQWPGMTLTEARPKVGTRVQAWTIATDDLKLTVGVVGAAGPRAGVARDVRTPDQLKRHIP